MLMNSQMEPSMLEESHCPAKGSQRSINEKEQLILEFLFSVVGSNNCNQNHNNYEVIDLNDGGMGSIAFIDEENN